VVHHLPFTQLKFTGMERLIELGYGSNSGFVFFRPCSDNDYRGLAPLYLVEVSQDHGGINQRMNDWQTQFKEAVRIMGEMNQRMNNTKAQFNELREEVKAFTQDLSPFLPEDGS